MPRVNIWAIGGAAALVVAVPNVLADQGGRRAAIAKRAALQRPVGSPQTNAGSAVALPSPGLATHVPRCVPVQPSSGYVNPLARAKVKAERIDQGVDYAGSGSLTAIGEARVTQVSTEGTGWPGAFVEYRLLHGPDAGCYVYYAEGIEPAAGLRPGETVQAGQPVATIISGWETGIEIGWGAGVNTKTLALQHGKWNANDDDHNKASSEGKSFSSLVALLGGPAGKNEGG